MLYAAGAVGVLIGREGNVRQMVTITKENFSLEQICQSGQCFRMEQLTEGSYSLVALGRYLRMEQEGQRISFHCSQEEFDTLWKDYFDLDTDYGRMIVSVKEEDTYLKAAAAYGSGVRILRQELWEMIISFIISQQNNIKRIRKCIDLLCRAYGEEQQTEWGSTYFTFPTPRALAAAELEDLYRCNLGYRSRYVKETAVCVVKGLVDLERVTALAADGAASGWEEVYQELKKLCGVGDKVAACICLFSLHHLDAFPVDTHIARVMKERYPKGFPFEAYPGYAGVLQQYIFYYDLYRSKM